MTWSRSSNAIHIHDFHNSHTQWLPKIKFQMLTILLETTPFVFNLNGTLGDIWQLKRVRTIWTLTCSKSTSISNCKATPNPLLWTRVAIFWLHATSSFFPCILLSSQQNSSISCDWFKRAFEALAQFKFNFFHAPKALSTNFTSKWHASQRPADMGHASWSLKCCTISPTCIIQFSGRISSIGVHCVG